MSQTASYYIITLLMSKNTHECANPSYDKERSSLYIYLLANHRNISQQIFPPQLSFRFLFFFCIYANDRGPRNRERKKSQLNYTGVFNDYFFIKVPI